MPHAPRTPTPQPYTPPLRTTGRCPTCHALVLTRLWVMAQRGEPGAWRELAPPISCVLGVEHRCLLKENTHV